MMRIRLTFVLLLCALTVIAPAAAQTRPVPAPAPAAPRAASPARVPSPVPAPAPAAAPLPASAEQDPQPGLDAQSDPEHWGREVLRIGQDYTLMPGDATGQVVVVAGNATIEGRVDRDVVVVLGRTRLSGTASINGSLIVLGGGSARIESGARVGRDLVVVGGSLDAPAQFTTGGQQIIIGPAFGGALEGIVPWISRGLLWGRPIVPDLPWVRRMVGIFFIVYLLLILAFHQPVRASADTLAERPLTSFVIGLLVLLLAAPVCLLLAVSIIGIAVVPFVLCAIVVAWILGKVGVAQWIGMRIFHQESRDSRLQSVRSFAIGFAMISLAYMVPLLGLIAWTTVGVFGLGGATLAFIAGYRRENPAPVPRVRPVAVVPTSVVDREEAALLPDLPPGELGFNPSEAPGAPAVARDAAAFPHAAFRDRLAAFVLDVILVLIAQQLLDLTRRDSAIFLLLLAYHIGFWTWKSTTVGGIICQLRVVRVDGKPLGFADALVRGLSSIFSLAVVGLGALWILKDSERQAWHDKIAGTYVVKVPRNWPL